MTADNWVGAIVFGLLGLVTIVVCGALLVARWPDVVAWWRQPPRSERVLRERCEKQEREIARLRDAVARLITDTRRLRQERNDLRVMLDDDARNSVTIIQGVDMLR